MAHLSRLLPLRAAFPRLVRPRPPGTNSRNTLKNNPTTIGTLKKFELRGNQDLPTFCFIGQFVSKILNVHLSAFHYLRRRRRALAADDGDYC